MRHHGSLAASSIAIAAMLGGNGALATPTGNTVTSPVASYNMAAIETAHGIVTVPFGSTIGAPAYVVAPGSELITGSQFTIGLPAGFLFNSAPGLTVSSGSASLTGGGIGSNTAVYTIGRTIPGGGILSLTPFSVSGADQLQFVTPSYSPLPMTFQASLLDAQPLTAGVFASAFAVLPDFRQGGGTIDLVPPTLGRAFGNDPATDVPTGSIGSVALDALQEDPFTLDIPLLNPNGTLATLATGDTATISFNGFFHGITSAFAVPTALGGSCPTTVPGNAVTGTVTDTTITFANFPIDMPGTYTLGSAGYYQICMAADGQTLLADNPAGFFVAMADGTDFTGLTVPDNNGLPVTDQFTYTGGTVVTASNFFTGTDSGYQSLLRVNNAGSGAATLYADVMPYIGLPTNDFGGSTSLIGLLATLPGGQGTVFTATQLEAAAPGLSLSDSSQRATVRLIAIGTGGQINASSLLINPGGIVGTMN